MIRERREQLKISQAELARRIGIAQPSLHNIEIGRTKRSRYLPDILHELKLDPRTYQPLVADGQSGAGAGVGSREPMSTSARNRDFPVFHMRPAEDDNEAMVMTSEPMEMVERPSLLGSVRDSFGICVYGDDNSPAYRSGDIVFVHASPPIIGSDVVIRPGRSDDDRITLGQLVGMTDTDWVILQYKNQKKIKLPRKEWSKCDRIVGRYNARY